MLARLLRRVSFGVCLVVLLARSVPGNDPIKDLQNAYIDNKNEKEARAYHFGSQGSGDVFSNHTSHSNRLVPVYVFGRKADLSAVTGKNSLYRDGERIRKLYGTLPANTVNPAAQYCDQSDLYHVQKNAVASGAKYLFTVWFDGMDWETTRAAAIAKTGKIYDQGKGSGLVFQDYVADGSAQFGFCVTSPTHDANTADVNAQTVTIPATSLGGGYDARIAGPNPWTPGDLKAPGYLKGQSANAADRAIVEACGGVLHAYTDSSQSAGEYATGVKAYNNGVNATDDGRFVPTLFHQLQAQGWKVGTVTSVPFDHVSPAAMYAHNVHRDDYQDLAREMLGLHGVVQQTGKDLSHPGLDVVIGCGWGVTARHSNLKKQGSNAVPGNPYIVDTDLKAIDVRQAGRYVVASRAAGVKGYQALQAAADQAGRDRKRLFGLYGMPVSGHLPYRTANGDYVPSKGIGGTAERYSQADLDENPTLADMTRAALTVLGAEEGRPFALFVEAGDVDFSLHDNNLDNTIGAVYSGDEAVKVIIDWVEKHSNWHEAVLIVTSDHGHYLVLDDPKALVPTAGR
jgi:alkaline phosphatase